MNCNTVVIDLNFIDLTGHRKEHILNRHRFGSGKKGKTEFDAKWSDEQILHAISDIATNPAYARNTGRWDSPYIIGEYKGAAIRVDFYPNTHSTYAQSISTAYPLE